MTLLALYLQPPPVDQNTKTFLLEWDKKIAIGDEAQAKRGILNLNYPFKHGYIYHFDDMVSIQYIYIFVPYYLSCLVLFVYIKRKKYGTMHF